jgi:hypothetical protein
VYEGRGPSWKACSHGTTNERFVKQVGARLAVPRWHDTKGGRRGAFPPYRPIGSEKLLLSLAQWVGPLMLDYLKYRRKLAKLRQQEFQIGEIFQKELRANRAQNRPRDELNGIMSEEYSELKPIREEIDILITSYLRAESEKHLIPFPNFKSTNMWEECSVISNQKVLSDLGIATVRSALRNELRERIKLTL